MSRVAPNFTQLTLEHRKNVIIYVLTIFVTLVALGTQLASTPAFGGDYQLFQLRAGKAAGILVSGLCTCTFSIRLRVFPLLSHLPSQISSS
jgi:hypothetical protein